MKPILRIVGLWVLTIGILLPATPARPAQETPTRPLTLSEAIQQALAHNPRIETAASRVDASQARVSQAKSGFYPQLNLQEAFNRTTNPMWAFGTKLNQEVITAADFDPARLNSPDPINNFATMISVEWPLFDAGQTWFGWRQAETEREASDRMLDRTRQEVIAQTAVAYTGTLLAVKYLVVVEQTLETAVAHLKLIRSRYEHGFVVKSDLLRAQVRIADLEQQRLQAESDIDIARAKLNATLGIAIDTPLETVSPLEKRTATTGTLETWIATALAHRPELEQMRLRETTAIQEKTKTRYAHLPSLHLVGNYEINSENFDDSADNYTIGAVVRLNLFSGHRLSAKTTEAEASLRQVQAMRREVDLGVRVQTRQAFFQAQSAWKRIQVSETAVIQAAEGLRIVRNRYENGLFTLVDLLDAEVALQQARTNYFRSLHDYQVARVQLTLAAGTLNAEWN
jgi:TolC family type I secretion outer membrane protein